MVGLESSMDLAESAAKTKKPKVDNSEKERQRSFLEQLRARKPGKVKTAGQRKAKKGARKGKKMTRARKGETYYCEVCGCEVVCAVDSEGPIICCDEEMCIIE